MMKDYTTYTNEELVTIIRSGDPDSDAVGDAYAQLFLNLKPVTLHESKMYSHKMDIYSLDDFIQEGQILMWDIIRKDNFKGGKFSTYYGKAIRLRLAHIWRQYNLKNLVCIDESEDDYGNTYRILVESDYIKEYRVKRAAEQKRYYEKRKAKQPPKSKKPSKPKLTKEERNRKAREYKKRYYAEHPEKLEERRAKARAYEKRKRERIKAERAEKALQAQFAMQAQTHETVANGAGM